MPPSPLPAPLPLWAKAILWLAPLGEPVADWLIDLLSFGEDEVDPITWLHVQTVFNRNSPSGTTEDVAVVTFDIVNITGGALDRTWTSGDWTVVNNALATFWTSVSAVMTNNHTFVYRKGYLRTFNPLTEVKPFADSGGPAFVAAISGTGQLSTGYMPYQISATITEKTPWPKHWGRLYIPGIGSASFDAYGRIVSATRTAMANAYQALNTTLQAGGFFLVVPVTSVNKTPVRGLLNVTGVQVDDIPDVQRRRRPRQAAARTVLP